MTRHGVKIKLSNTNINICLDITTDINTNKIHSVKKQVQLHFSCTAVSSEDSSAIDLLMLQTRYKVVHVCTGTYMHTVYAMGVVHNLMLCMYVLARTCMQTHTCTALNCEPPPLHKLYACKYLYRHAQPCTVFEALKA